MVGLAEMVRQLTLATTGLDTDGRTATVLAAEIIRLSGWCTL